MDLTDRPKKVQTDLRKYRQTLKKIQTDFKK